MMKIIKDLFTGPDGETFDPARMLWIGGILFFLAFTGHEVYTTNKFDMVNFGIAYGGLLAAGAAGCKIKESNEPKPKTDPAPEPKTKA